MDKSELSVECAFNSGQEGMENYQCRICAKPLGSPYSRMGYEWAVCGHCKSIQKVMDKSGYHSLAPSYDPGCMFSDEMTDAQISRVLGVAEKTRILRSYRSREPQKFLDIGCGAGGYLLAARSLGFEVRGIEPSLSHSEVARTKLGLPVTNGYFESGKLSEQFDVVMLSHVIEHIFEPLKFIEDIFRVVAPGGALIVVTPNVESLSAKITGKYWSMLKPVDHVTMLGKRSMSICCPPGAMIESLYTHEWPGEFAAHMVSACKQWVRPSISNMVSVGRPRITAQKETISVVVKSVLALLSSPFFAMASGVDRKSCLTAVFRKQ